MDILYKSRSNADLEKIIKANRNKKEFKDLVERAKKELNYRKGLELGDGCIREIGGGENV